MSIVGKVVCKFRCMNVQPAPGNSPDYTAIQVRMIPIWEEKGVNREWSSATPSGELNMLITNPAAADQFTPGQNYMLEITPVD